MIALAAAAPSVGWGVERPNILLLVAEDLSPHLGVYGDAVAQTPRLDALAREGVRYTNVFTTAGVCAPSRAALVTGLHAISIGAQHMRTSSRPAGGYTTVPPEHVKAFPELLRAAGYYTYTDSKLDYQFSGPLYGTGPASIWDDEGFGTHWRNRPDDRPFFGMINFMATHESGVFTPLGSWPQNGMHFLTQVSRAWLMDIDAPAVTSPDDVVLPPYYPDTPTIRADVARHYDNVHFMDGQVGRILDELEADGLLESTIVIFTTDHGDGLPRAKRELYDSGLHVPLIVRWPESLRPGDAARGSVDAQLVSFVDLAPSILELAGVPVPDWMPGRDFLRDTTPRREYVFAARDRIDDVPDRQRAARDERYKYIRSWVPDQPGGHAIPFRDTLLVMQEIWRLHEAGELDPVQELWFQPPGEERLFDTKSDPFELVDRSNDPALQPVLDRMRAALVAWQERVGDTGEIPEDELVALFWPDGEQPKTAPPKLEWLDGNLVVSATTPGASNEVRMDGGAWRLSTGPIAVPSGGQVEVRSVRYGYEASDVVSIDTP